MLDHCDGDRNAAGVGHPDVPVPVATPSLVVVGLLCGGKPDIGLSPTLLGRQLCAF